MGLFHTKLIREGQKVALWKSDGKVRIIDGPRRLWVGMRESCDNVPRFTATEHEYLIVKFIDGHSEHLRGPCYFWKEPNKHASVVVANATHLDSGEAIVVFRKYEDGQIKRNIVTGPMSYVPTADEWIHDFVWHGSDPANPSVKVPGALKFQRIRVIPDQFYVDVREVRTCDDALLTVKLMVFFELVDIDFMLDKTHDPIADFINACSADVIKFASVLKLENFLEKTNMLNEMETYMSLAHRAKGIGYKVNKVVYRGYSAGERMQNMHDKAIQSRTHLRLEAETEEMAQELADLKLDKEMDRQIKKQKMQKDEVEHNNQLSNLESQQRIKEKQEEKSSEISGFKAENEEKLNYLKSLKALQVDITQYLVSQFQKPDRLIQIGGSEGNGSKVHLHHNA